MLETESKIVVNNVNKVKFNSNSKMNREELRSNHPEVYSAVVSEGVTQERERVASWLTYQTADPEMVAQGIESGEAITPSQREKLMVKMNSQTMLEAMRSDSSKDVKTDESKTDAPDEKSEDKDQLEVNSFYSNLAKKI